MLYVAIYITYTYMYKKMCEQWIDIIQVLVYVIVWLAVVFGINNASNAGRKIVIVRGAAEHY